MKVEEVFDTGKPPELYELYPESEVQYDGGGVEILEVVREEGIGVGDWPMIGPGIPNPFGVSTEFSVQIRREGNCRVEVLGVDGRRIRVLMERYLRVGTHGVPWDGRDESGEKMASGTFFVRVTDEWGGVSTTAVRLVK